MGDISNSIVHITNTGIQQWDRDPYKKLNPITAYGTGFIVNMKGSLAIVTNAHVANNKKIFFIGSTKHPTKLKVLPSQCHINNDRDIAIILLTESNLKTELGKTLKPLEIDDRFNLHDTGEEVSVVGFPQGSDDAYSDTRGHLNKVTRIKTAHSNISHTMLQISAAINPGNSGGPVLSSEGKVIGVVTQVITNSQSIGHAVPVSAALKTMNEIEKYGRTFPTLIIPVYTGLLNTKEARAPYKLPDTGKGIVIMHKLDPYGTMAKLNLEEGDIILSIRLRGKTYSINSSGLIDIETHKNTTRVAWRYIEEIATQEEKVDLLIRREIAKNSYNEIWINNIPRRFSNDGCMITRECPEEKGQRYFLGNGVAFMIDNYQRSAQLTLYKYVLPIPFTPSAGLFKTKESKERVFATFIDPTSQLSSKQEYKDVTVGNINGVKVKSLYEVRVAFHCAEIMEKLKPIIQLLDKAPLNEEQLASLKSQLNELRQILPAALRQYKNNYTGELEFCKILRLDLLKYVLQHINQDYQQDNKFGKPIKYYKSEGTDIEDFAESVYEHEPYIYIYGPGSTVVNIPIKMKKPSEVNEWLTESGLTETDKIPTYQATWKRAIAKINERKKPPLQAWLFLHGKLNDTKIKEVKKQVIQTNQPGAGVGAGASV